MKVTLSAAMRARDVSRPRPEDEEAARAAAQTPAGKARPDRAERPDRPERAERAEPGGRPAAGRNTRGRRKRR
ncbi:MAG TPA: hypothetical protein VGJ19_01660 [Streptosporangiaceae bacterium]|jgi:hypothetical protein